MKNNKILNQKSRIEEFISQKRLRDAFVELKHMSDGAMAWEITDEINRLEEAYKLMLTYAKQGADDPSRSSLYDNIVNDMHLILDRVVRQRLAQEESSLYFNSLRTEKMRQSVSLESMLSDYAKLDDDLSIYNMIISEGKNQQSQTALEEREALERRIFNRI